MFAILLMEGKGWIGGKFGGLSDASVGDASASGGSAASVASPYK